MVRLEPYRWAHRGALTSFQLPTAQLAFTAHPSDFTYSVEPDPARLRVVVVEGEVVVGFGLLATGPYRDAYLRGAHPGVVALTAFSVDARAQGRGVGTRAMQALPAFVREAFPAAQRVALVVHQRNDRARRLYERAGFVVVGERRGSGGSQWILDCPLRAAQD